MTFKLGIVSVIMPAYNLESIIKETINKTNEVLSKIDCNYEIIVVNDGSKDATYRMVKSINNSRVRVLNYKVNQGKGFALTMGAINSVGDYIVFIDGDNEINIEKLGQYLSALKHSDIVVGSKWHPNSVIELPVRRRILSLGFNVLVRLMTGINSWDSQVGFKAFRRDTLFEILKLVSVRKYAFDVEVLIIASLLKKRISVVPIEIHANTLFSVKNIFRMFIDILGISYRLNIKRWYQKNYYKKIPQKYKPIIRW